MDLKEGGLLWVDTFPDAPAYPRLQEDLTCDVVVVGGGEGGANCAYQLSEYGVDTVMLERRRVGYGSTSANTGLIQYSNDAPMHQLAESLGLDVAVRYYKLCQRAVDVLDHMSQTLADPIEFKRRDSLYYASSEKDVKKLEAEYALQTRYGFPVAYWTEEQVAEQFPFRKAAALYATGDAELNPFRFAHALVRHAARKHLRVYEETEVCSIFHENGRVCLRTSEGQIVRAKKAVIATGYEAQENQRTPGAVVESSYAIATEPVRDFSSYASRCLIWETARPYLYMRTTFDDRIVVGGLDESAFEGPKRDNLLPQKAEQLLIELKRLFPAFADLKISHRWTAAFGGTKDGLPFIGEHPFHENCYYALGYGGNGTVYAIIAGEIIKELILHGQHPDAPLFAVERMR